MRLQGKVALITGGAGGIGAQTARQMAAEGAQVAITDLADGSALATEIGCQYYRHDVAQEEDWATIVQSVKDRHGGIDILVNAAGIEGDLSDASALGSYAEWRRVMTVNLDGTFLGVKAVLPVMMEKGTGSIINLSSLVAFIGTPVAAPYGASKAAVWQFSRSVASFGAMNGHRIRCNSVHPGLIRTRMTDKIFSSVGELFGMDGMAVEDQQLRMIPFGERGSPGDVAHLLVYLASDEAAYVTGAEFKVDGGWSIGNPK